MKKINIPFVLIIFGCMFLNAQKKSDLLIEIHDLKSKLDSTSNLLAESRRNERVSKTNAENMELEVEQLKESNVSLMNNINNLTQLSIKNSENTENSLSSLKRKEKQLKGINDAIALSDSTALVVLTQIKKTMGEDVQVAVSEGSVTISEKQETFFDGAKKDQISAGGKEFLKKIATFLTTNPNFQLTIESLGASVDLKSSTSWSGVLSTVLQEEFKITPDHVIIGFDKSGFTDEIRFKLHPNFNQFYLKTREYLKN